MEKPTRESVIAAMPLMRMRGRGFSTEYTRGQQQTRSILYEGKLYPLKALWAAAHNPPVTSADLNFYTVLAQAKELGFTVRMRRSNRVGRVSSHSVTEPQIADVGKTLAAFALEGKRALVESEVILRNAAIVAAVKRKRAPICEACGFDFEESYGEHGKGYIECHHIEPLHTRGGASEITSEEDLALLCANCHRMVHRRSPHLSLDELREILLREG